MGNITTEHYASAVILVGKRLLLVRELGKDDFPSSGFHFPGGKARRLENMKEDLQEALLKKYGAKIKIVEEITPLALAQNGRKVVLHGFLCEPLSRFSFPAAHFEHVYADLGRISEIYLDPLDRKLAEKVARFFPLYAYKKRLFPLSQKEKGEASFYLDSLFYFRSALPDKELSDFSLLIRSDSTIEEIRSAFFWLLGLYGLDLNAYLDVLEYRKKHQKI